MGGFRGLGFRVVGFTVWGLGFTQNLEPHPKPENLS